MQNQYLHIYMCAGAAEAIWSNKLRENSCPLAWYVIRRVVAAWVVRSKAATVRYFWITHSCLI